MESKKIKKYLEDNIKYRSNYIGNRLRYFAPSDLSIQRDLTILEVYYEILHDFKKDGLIK